MKKAKLIILSTVILISQLFYDPLVSLATTNTLSKTANQSANINEIITSIKLNDKAVTFKKPLYLKGKYIQIPADEFFSLIAIKPEIDKITGIYTIKHDGATIKFNSKTGRGSLSIFNNNKEIVVQLSEVSIIKNNIVYLNWPNFPMNRLGVASGIKDVPGKSNQKSLVINNLTSGIGSIVKSFKVTDSDNFSVEWKQEYDSKDLLKLYGTIKISSKIISNQALNLLDIKTGETNKQSPYMEVSYNNMLYTNRPVQSNEISVFEMGLYQNGNLVTTLIDGSTPKASSGSSRFNITRVSFDEIKVKSYYLNTNDCKDRLSGISIEIVNEEQLLAALKQSSSYNWIPHLVSDQIEIAAYVALNSAATVSVNNGYLPTNRYSSLSLDQISGVLRKETSRATMGTRGINLELSTGNHMFIAYNEKNMPIKILYLR